MKIVPVNTPTVSTQPQTGLSSEKIQRIKEMAASKIQPQEGDVKLGEQTTHQTQRIKMDVTKTPNEIFADQQTEVEPVTEPEVVTPDTDVQAKPTLEAIKTVSPELAELARRTRALQVKEREMAERETSLKSAEAARDELIKELKATPLAVLQKHGVTYDQLTQEILGNQSNGEVLALKAQVDALTKDIDDKFSAKDTAQEEAVYNFMRQEVDKMSNLAPYRFIKEANAQDKVMDLIKRSWKEQGEILTEDEAMNLIEAELREDAKRYAQIFGELEPKSPEEIPPAQTAQRVVPKTLTNKDSARPLMSRRQRAIAAALGQK